MRLVEESVKRSLKESTKRSLSTTSARVSAKGFGSATDFGSKFSSTIFKPAISACK